MKTRLIPTATGCFWVLASLILLGFAINYASNLCFALAFLMFSIWVLAARECFSAIGLLEWVSLPIRPVFAGETLIYSGRAHGLSASGQIPFFLCAGKGKKRIEGLATRGEKAGLAKEARQDIALEMALPALKRGYQELKGLSLVVFHPLGLWRASRGLPDARALIWPFPAGTLPLPEDAPKSAHKKFESGDFQDIRAYAPGDSERRINWRVYGRRDELVVNQFDGGTGGQAVFLDIAKCPGDTESRLSQICQWVQQSEKQGREYGIKLGGETLLPGQGVSHQQECLKFLALYGEEKTDEPRQTENFVKRLSIRHMLHTRGKNHEG